MDDWTELADRDGRTDARTETDGRSWLTVLTDTAGGDGRTERAETDGTEGD